MVRVKVKICGVTQAEDALMAVEAGADALGFMFYESSPRLLSFAKAAEIIRVLPPFVAKVGVFVDPAEEFVRRAIDQCGLDTLQFHGQEPPEFCRQFRLKVIKAFRIRDAAALDEVHRYGSETWLFDSYVAGKPGGTGEVFNWELARIAVQKGGRVILAGGLTAGNVAQAIRQVQPFGVDVSSGVESTPGRKDPAKVRAFIQAARFPSQGQAGD